MFKFEGYTLDIVRGCLRRADREVELRAKSFEVLRHLVENADRLVSKSELIATVWPNVVVSDESLSQCVSEVRQAIGDRGQNIIKTIPRRGYRFAVHVLRCETDTVAHSQTAPIAGERSQVGPDTNRRWDSPLLDRPSVAVLPFVNLSGDARQEYFSDGITEDIITELSRFSELFVIARNSTFQYKGKAVDVRTVSQELGVRYVLEGSIRREGNRVRINAQLIDAMTGAHRWAERYDREIKDIFAVQEEVAREIVAILAAYVNKAEAERTLLKLPATWEAYDYYMRGAEAFSRRARESPTAAIYEARRFFERSLSIDPNYARAHAMLSQTYWWTYVEPVDDDYLIPAGLEHAHDLAKKAVQLDPNLPQTHAQLGWVLLHKRQHEAGGAEFERAFALNHNFVDHRFALYLIFTGEPAKAVETLQTNICLDPFHPFASFGFLGHAYYMLKRYKEAAQTLQVYPSRAPNVRIFPLWLAAANAQLGQLGEAKAEAAEVLRIEPGFTIERWKCTVPYKNPEDAEHLFDGLRKAGLPEG
jgi:adenylate cyclase